MLGDLQILFIEELPRTPDAKMVKRGLFGKVSKSIFPLSLFPPLPFTPSSPILSSKPATLPLPSCKSNHRSVIDYDGGGGDVDGGNNVRVEEEGVTREGRRGFEKFRCLLLFPKSPHLIRSASY